MTREEKLYSMKGRDLINEADKLGIKVNCNKTRTQLSEAKSNVVERILAAEAAQNEEAETIEIEETAVEKPVIEETQVEEISAEEVPAIEEIEEEIIPPFIYTDENGQEWEDADIAEMIHKWSDEKKSEFRKWFDELVSNAESDLDALDHMCNVWSFNWDAEHGIKKEKKEDHSPTPKRGALIEWNGKSQNICKWGEELGISPNTLYGRIYKMGWTIEKAFTTRPR